MAIIRGTNGDDRYPRELEGTDLADQIFGLAGNDVLIGFDGDDVLEGGKGADELFGSDGLDLASYRNSPAGVSVFLSDPFDPVSGGDAEGDTLSSIEGAIGSAFADGLFGDEQRNVLRGEGGADHLRGNDGNDRLEGGGGNDLLAGSAGSDELRGGDGTDTADFYYLDLLFGGAAIAGAGVVADLVAGTATGGDQVGSDRLFGIENLHGTLHNDRLLGNAGANRLEGEGGADELVGRVGADRFDYDYTDESTPAAADRILDFSRAQGDRIDLVAVDANEQASGDQAFRFVGQAQFTGAGQVRFYQQNGDTIVEANTDNTAPGAELRIEIDPVVSLQAGDFLL